MKNKFSLVSVERHGFTIVELSLTITFLATLLVAVVSIIITSINNYQKSITLRLVNDTGRSLIDEFSTTASYASSIDYQRLCTVFYSENSDNKRQCIEDSAYRLIYQQWYYEINDTKVPAFGAFCTGKYSYVWNTGYVFLASTNNYEIPYATVSYEYSGQQNELKTLDGGEHFRLVRMPDVDHSICASQILENYDKDSMIDLSENTDAEGSVMLNFDFSVRENPNEAVSLGDDTELEEALNLKTISEAPIELITNSTTPVMIFDFAVFRPLQNQINKRMFYSASMTIATLSAGLNLTGSSDFCSTSSSQSDYISCAANKFNFAMRATGD